MDTEHFDHVVLGAGLRGLRAALQARRTQPAASLLLVDAAPRAGGRVQTQRSNGFVCELGPFAFSPDELVPHLAALAQPPRLVEALDPARRGHHFDGTQLVPVDLEAPPRSFATGNEELVQAYRRELGTTLRLGRAATALQPTADGLLVTLGGEVPTRIATTRLTLAVPLAVAARLLAPFDHELPACAERIGDEPRAFVFFGGHGSDAPELRGYGIVPAATVDTPCAELVFCTQVFAQRALPGRFLVRAELAGDALAADDAALAATAEAELRRWTGTAAPMPFTKVHRFAAAVEHAADVECRVRLRAIAGRLDALRIA